MQLSLSLRILEMAAVYVEDVQASHVDSDREEGKYLIQEYYVLRIMLVSNCFMTPEDA